VQIANLFHTWEAVLASLAIFIGHFYDEHFGKFLNMSWLTGTISEEEMRHEHPVEYEDIMGTPAAVSMSENANPVGSNSTSGNIMLLGFAKLVFTVVFLAICIWMLWISYEVLVEAVNTYIL
jgi:hypothetical protein